MHRHPLLSRGAHSVYARWSLLLLLIWASACPTLAQLAPATAAELFARLPEYETARMSPTGKWIAVAVLRDGLRAVAILDLQTLEPSHIVRFNPPHEAERFYWGGDNRLLVSVATRIGTLATPVLTGELFAVDATGDNPRSVFGGPAAPSSNSASNAGLPTRPTSVHKQPRLLSMLAQTPDEVLISTHTPGIRGLRDSDSARLNINTGRLRRVVRGPRPNAVMLADTSGEVRFAVARDDDLTLQVFSRNPGADWQLRINKPFRTGDWLPVGFDADDQVLVLDNTTHDRIGVYRFDLRTNQQVLVFRDAHVDVDAVLAAEPGAQPYAIRYLPARTSYVVLTPETPARRLFAQARAQLPDMDIELTSVTRTGDRAIVRAQSDTEPGALYLLSDRQPAELLFRVRSWLMPTQLAKTEVFDIRTRDGLAMQVFLNRPLQAAKRPPPLVLYPHGGPHGARDSWLFDELTQLLASQGYAVLRPNYRGSGGYGRAFSDAGYGEWSTAMLRDLIDSVDWAIDAGIADPQRIAIVGESYGAYAALMSAAKFPQRFRCVVATSGVYDLSLLLEGGDLHRSIVGKALLKHMLGDDKAVLRAASPLMYARAINVPVLLVHGDRDQRVPVIHARQMQTALAQARKQVEYLELPGEGHGFFAAASRERYFGAVLQFLVTHLGPTDGRRPP